MADHRSVRANHEGGVKHKANVAKSKLNNTRKIHFFLYISSRSESSDSFCFSQS